ncbi:sucrase ferredoxin [Nocardioides jiangxiensis]|uniref:Sucrase ferredoxin n=1 Tax=Nocardioides jiangxiensis TaxID=3064524 RepID=A0ABT9B0W8_9ACTN|nr:sucrase ferredoxin [Nocardioides sp. WY-20]MDO7867959.1 sucrase ferredoxin [Nocardioides sp. WY-20]
MTSPFRCSAAALRLPMAGTAATDAGFLLVEHPGPWGNKALAESRLVPDEARAALAAATSALGIRVQLIRRPGERGAPDAAFRVFLAHPASGRLDVQQLDDRAALADLDLALDVRGAGWQPYDGSLLLVCTNGRRDVCCAEFGRPVAQAAAAALPEETWETTHLGGHRFAVAVLTLPDGMSYGRVDPEAALRIGEAARAGAVVPAHLRGRTSYPPHVQAAEVALYEQLGVTAADAFVLTGDTTAGGQGVVTFRAGDGEHVVDVRAREEVPARQSCADLTTKPSTTWRASVRAPAGSD